MATVTVEKTAILKDGPPSSPVVFVFTPTDDEGNPTGPETRVGASTDPYGNATAPAPDGKGKIVVTQDVASA